MELGLTQDEAAAALGVDVRTWRRYESGEVNDPTKGFAVRNASRRRLLDRIARELGVPEGELLVEPVEDPPGHVLQPARHFVGRAHELARLRALVADEGARIIALVAPGGAGKTALARELARTLPAARVWSFYESPDADAFLRGASAHSGFVVLDGLEALQSNGSPARARGELEAPALRAWLRRVADGQAPQRALVTSRLPLVDVSAWEGGAVTTVALGPLDDASAGALLRRHGLRADSAAFAEALARFGGHALSLDVLGSLAGRWLDGDAARLPPLDLDAAAEDDPRARRLARLLRHYADRLTPFERDLLARLSAFARGAPVDALAGLAAAPPSLAGALAGATRADIARRLARLADAGLVFAQRAFHPSARCWGVGNVRASPTMSRHPSSVSNRVAQSRRPSSSCQSPCASSP